VVIEEIWFMSVSRRDHLVDTALKLFCEHGFRATGIDTVLRESGVAKKTLYNHFKSKDELIVAALHKRDEDFLGNLRARIDHLTPLQEGDPRMSRVLAFFDGLDEWIAGENFNGCTFINASAEYPRREDTVHRACADHKKLVVQLVEELLADLMLKDTQLVARQIALLADGAIVNAHTAGDQQSAWYAKMAARQLLESYVTAQGQGTFRRKTQ
jgi:AcrR family transcriptional regulator